MTMSTSESNKTTVFDIVTDRIVQSLEKGCVPWRREWDASGFQMPRNLKTGKPYRGINFFLLTAAGERFASPYWLTFNQARERGAHVRKGERGAPAFFWRVYDQKEGDDCPDSEESERRFVARYYTVF